MGVLGDKLTQAIDANKNSVSSYIWKSPKQYSGGSYTQEEIRMIDATEEQLKTWYAHCQSMLYSKDADNPGRFTLIELIKRQRMCCNAQLYIKYLHKKGTAIFDFRESLTEFLNRHETLEAIPRSKWKETPISSVVQVPDEFKNLSIDIILDACLDSLGLFDRKHITLSFLTKFGIYFTPDEKKNYLNATDKDGKLIPRLEQVKKNLNLRDDIKLYVSNKHGLSYLEFRAMHKLYRMRYSAMTEEQLRCLRDKVLFRLEDDCRKHIELWKEKIEQLEKVCEERGITLS